MSTPAPVRPEHAFSEKAGEAWVRLQDQTDAQIDPFGRVAISKLGLVPGERVLDVGCGCGQTLLELAELVGPGGHVLGVDISAPMLARARERAADQANITLCLADAQTHAFAAADFDAIFSRFGVMFFQDAHKAFANLRPALRAGGRVAFVCWQAIERNPWADLPLRAVMRVLQQTQLPPLVDAQLPGPFYFSDPQRVQAILSGAGFDAVAIQPVELSVQMGGAATLEQAVAYCRQIGPAARATADVAPAMRPALDAAVAEALAPFVSERGVWLPGAAFVVTARVS